MLIREVYQAPELQGRVSFPKSGPLPPELRAYTKDRALRLDIDEDVISTDEEDEDLSEGEGEQDETTTDIEYYEEGANPESE